MILIDTDVLIDVALDRHPFSGPSSELLDRIESGSEGAYMAWHSVSNLYYLVSPSRGGVNTRDFIVELTRFVGVAVADAESIRYAAALPHGRLRGRHASGRRPRLRRQAHRDQKPQGLRTVSNSRGRPARGLGRTVLNRAQAVQRSIFIFSRQDGFPYETIHHGSSR